MKKQEFITALRRGLADLPSGEVERVISYYEEGIADRMEEGMSEEEAVAALGSVAENVNAAREGTGQSGGDERDDCEEREYISVNPVTRLTLKASNTTVVLGASQDASFHVRYQKNKWSDFIVDETAGELSISKHIRDHGISRWLNFVAGILTASPATVTITVPAGYDGLLRIRTGNGRITGGGFSAGNAEMKTDNGRVEMTDVSVTGSLEMTTSNGRIEVENCRAGKALALNSSNGRIHVETVAFGTSCNLQTSNGRIYGSVCGKADDYDIQAGTSNGRNNLPKGRTGGIPMSVHTSNGAIDVSFAGETPQD